MLQCTAVQQGERLRCMYLCVNRVPLRCYLFVSVCVLPVCITCVPLRCYLCVFLCVCYLCVFLCVTFIFCVLSACVCYLCITCVLVESEELGLQSLTRPLSQQDGGGALRVWRTHLHTGNITQLQKRNLFMFLINSVLYWCSHHDNESS